MHANSMCISCIVSAQEKQIREFPNEDKKSEYMHQVLKLLCDKGQSESAPALTEDINRIYREFWGEDIDYSDIKHRYNQLLLAREAELEQRISQSSDPVKECIKYVCAVNYIDFGAVENFSDKTFETLLERAAREQVPEEEYHHFRTDLQHARSLVYLTDNCGEIVLDKVFLRHIKRAYPDLQITVILRGSPVINDATLEDAREVGLTEVVSCIGNGTAAPGTVLARLSKEANKVLQEADVVISKGQGNFESLFGEGVNPYYFFLCKCQLFVRRFGLVQYEPVFCKEERMRTRF